MYIRPTYCSAFMAPPSPNNDREAKGTSGLSQGGQPVRILDPPPLCLWRGHPAQPTDQLKPPSPPPPSDPSKVFEPVFLQFEILGERGGRLRGRKKFLPFLRGYLFFHPMCLYSKYSEFCGEFKNV